MKEAIYANWKIAIMILMSSIAIGIGALAAYAGQNEAHDGITTETSDADNGDKANPGDEADSGKTPETANDREHEENADGHEDGCENGKYNEKQGYASCDDTETNSGASPDNAADACEETKPDDKQESSLPPGNTPDDGCEDGAAEPAASGEAAVFQPPGRHGFNALGQIPINRPNNPSPTAFEKWLEGEIAATATLWLNGMSQSGESAQPLPPFTCMAPSTCGERWKTAAPASVQAARL